MNEVETKAIMGVEPKTKTPLPLTSQNLLNYLCFDSGVSSEEFQFPLHIKFEHFKDKLKELAFGGEKTYYYSDEERSQYNLGSDRLEGLTDREKSVVEEMCLAESEKKVYPERSVSIYWDPNSLSFKSTKILQGNYLSAPLPFIEGLKAGGLPILDIHTHPNDTPPSYEDYGLLMLDPYGRGTPAEKGIALVCPNVQFLALSTNNTPLFKERRSWLNSIDYWIKINKDYADQATLDYANQIEKADQFATQTNIDIYPLPGVHVNGIFEYLRSVRIKLYAATDFQNYSLIV